VAPAAARPARPIDVGALHRMTFHGSAGSLLGIHAVNSLLALLTLGIYQFWGRVRIRRYVMSQTALAGDRFAYHGTGRELCVGFLKAFLVFGLPVAVLMGLAALEVVPAVVRVVAQLAASAIVFFLFAFAVVGAHRYRLSRTSLRGIRFSFRGRALDFAKLFLKGVLLTVVTLGFYRPVFETRLRAFLTSNSYFGNQKFEFDGQGRDLVRPYLVTVLLFVPTLGLSTFWYLARKQRYLWAHTRFASARFHSTVRGGHVLLLVLGNAFLLLLLAALGVGAGLGLGEVAGLDLRASMGLAAALGLGLIFGLGWPWLKFRTIRFAVVYLTLSGPLDLGLIQQEARTASATAEAVAGFFDVDFDLG
jgi:uncharacterized membrane protein YjgN (DUF898 family)